MTPELPFGTQNNADAEQPPVCKGCNKPSFLCSCKAHAAIDRHIAETALPQAIDTEQPKD